MLTGDEDQLHQNILVLNHEQKGNKTKNWAITKIVGALKTLKSDHETIKNLCEKRTTKLVFVLL